MQRVLLAEGVLQRRQLSPLRREAFYRSDRRTVSLHSKHAAGTHGFAVEHHGACAADPVFTADMRTGQTEFVAKEINERHAGLDGPLVLAAVDRNADVHKSVQVVHGQWLALRALSAAFSRTRSPSTVAR
ncbi:hypothetical protein D9M72_617980 [compost metagenome]